MATEIQQQTRAEHEERGTNRLDPGGAVAVHTMHSPLATTPTQVPATAGAASAGNAFRTYARERITVYVEVPAGSRGAMTQLFVVPEVAFVRNPQDVHFFPLHEDEAGDGVLVAKSYEGPTLSGAARIAWAFRVPTHGVWMRFRIYGTAANTASRATVWVTRHTDSL